MYFGTEKLGMNAQSKLPEGQLTLVRSPQKCFVKVDVASHRSISTASMEVDATTRIPARTIPNGRAELPEICRLARVWGCKQNKTTAKISPKIVSLSFFNASNRQCSPSFTRLATAFCWSRLCVS